MRLLGGGRLGSGGSEGALLVLPFLDGADDCDGMIDFLILFEAMKRDFFFLTTTPRKVARDSAMNRARDGVFQVASILLLQRNTAM